jgi:NAD(P)-dependent dehydrogenase (short-subunit alcohol dehydrogenase family)
MQTEIKNAKTALITGSTSGIGDVTARELARLGFAVTIAGRDKTRCQATIARIRASVPTAQVDYLLADLSEMSQVRRLAEEFQQRHERLDALVNNAGVFYLRRGLTPDGFERTFAVNHLSYFLLTNLLLSLLADTAAHTGEARVVNVSSNAHRGAQLDFEDLGSIRHYQGWRAYCRSKLANILFTFELDRRLQGRGVSANALHPGFVSTNIGVNHNPIMRLLYRLFIHPRTISPEEGAQTSVYLVSSPEVKGLSGAYFVRCKGTRADPAAYDHETARRLWEISAEMVGT